MRTIFVFESASLLAADLRRSFSVKLNSQYIAFRYKTRFSENYTTIREIQVLLQCRLLFDLQPSNSSKKSIREIIQPSEKFTIYLISPIRDKVGNCHPFYLHVSELHGAATGFMAVATALHLVERRCRRRKGRRRPRRKAMEAGLQLQWKRCPTAMKPVAAPWSSLT